MKKNSIPLSVIAIALSIAPMSAAYADGTSGGHGPHKHPPFPVVKQHILARMQKMQKTTPAREACVEKSQNFRELHACFPHHKWHHQWHRPTQGAGN